MLTYPTFYISNVYISNVLTYPTFTYPTSPTKAGGVGAYISNVFDFSLNENLQLQVQGCEDLWFEIELNSCKMYTFAVIYRHPSSNPNTFIDALDNNLHQLNEKKGKTVIVGDINFDINPSNNNRTSFSDDYLRMLQSNAFASLITKPTRVTSHSQTIIDHILTNDFDSIISPGVLTYSISDHSFIFCTILTDQEHCSKPTKPIEFRSLKSVDRVTFIEDLNSALDPLVNKFLQSPFPEQIFETNFEQVIDTISLIINNHAPLQTLSRKRKRL